MDALVWIGDTHPTVFKWFADITTAEFKSRLTEDLASQLGIYAVSLSDRISRYEREEVGSTPALRASERRLHVW